MPETAGRVSRGILSDVTALVTSGVATRLLGAAAAFVTARVLGPGGFGILKAIELVPSLAKFGSLGFDSVAVREVVHLRSRGADPARVQHVRSVAFTADLVWSVVLGVAVLVSSLAAEGVVRYGLWIAAFSLMGGQILRLYSAASAIDQAFQVMAKAGVVGALVQSLTVLALIWWGGVLAVLAAGLVGVAGSVWWYTRHQRLGLEVAFDRPEFVRLARIAVPLAGGTLAYGVFGWAERLLVLDWLGPGPLGIYMLTVSIQQLVQLVLGPVLRVMSVRLYEGLGDPKEADSTTCDLIIGPTLVLGFVLPISAGAMCMVVPGFLARALPEYQAATPLLPWLGVVITSQGVGSICLTAMNSARLDMQVRFMALWLGATALFAAGAFLAVQQGAGLGGVMVGKAVAMVVMAAAGVRWVLVGLQVPGPARRSLAFWIVGACLYSAVAGTVTWIVAPGSGVAESLLRLIAFLALSFPLLAVGDRRLRLRRRVAALR